MLTAFLITLREVIEASLIVVTICSLLIKTGRSSSVKIVLGATCAAIVTSITLIVTGSLLGARVHDLYAGRYEALFEGIMLLLSGLFTTSAIIWIHGHFASHKVRLIKKLNESVNSGADWSLAALVFTTVVREGIEICAFLATIYMTSRAQDIFVGYVLGLLTGVGLAYATSRYALRIPVYQAFRVSTFVLILSGAAMISSGIAEIVEYGLLPAGHIVTFAFLPPSQQLMAQYIRSFLGLSRHMNVLQIWAYVVYTATMCCYVTRPSIEAQS